MDIKKRYFSLCSIALIGLLGFAIYSNTLTSSFHFDDEKIIVTNLSIRNLQDLGVIWNIWATRFITHLTLAINYRLGELDVTGYHFFNIFIHLSSAIAIWWLVMLTLSTPAMKDQKIAKHSGLIALFAGLLFVAHPIQTEAVTYIVQRAASMATMFYLASIGLYAKSRLLEIENPPSGSARLYYLASLIVGILAMFTKEIAITLPLAICLYEFSFLKTQGRFRWRRIIPFLFILWIIPLTMLAHQSLYFKEIQNEAEANAGIAPFEYLFTQFRVLVTYLRLVFFPLNQNLDYDYRISRTFFEPAVLGSLGLILFILATAVRLFQKYKIISFGLFWFFLTLLPESSLMPIRDVIYEHRLYLPMAGFSLFLVGAIYTLAGKKSLRLVVVILSVTVLACSILTYRRNVVWKNEWTLWNDVVRKSPGKARPIYNRGLVYESRRELDKAITDYSKAIMLEPNFYAAYNNRGDVYKRKGEPDKAMDDFNKAIEINPGGYEAYNNRGSAYQYKGDLDRAIADFSQAVEIKPDYDKAYSNRGNAYQSKGEFDRALSDYNKALEIRPGSYEAYNNRGLVYQSQNALDKALADYNKALEIKPDYEKAYANRGNVYQLKGEFDRAILDYNRALKIMPDFYEVYANRGLAYQSKNELDKAISDFSKAIDLNPQNGSAYGDRAVAYFLNKEYEKSLEDVRKAEAIGNKPSLEFISNFSKDTKENQS